MNIAFCYESVLPARGGCETYITDLARRLVADGHEIHLYASRWDESAMPEGIYYHRLPQPHGPRFLRPWLFGRACLRALRGTQHLSVGFDKVWGLDVLYPQGGLHAASADHNLRKHANPTARRLARLIKRLDLAHWSYTCLERHQYLAPQRPLIVVNSLMVQRHFEHYYGVGPDAVRVIRNSIAPDRFDEHDRPRRRVESRQEWGLGLDEPVALFVAMNYRLKGLEPLLHSLTYLGDRPLRLLIAGNSRTGHYERLAHRLGVHGRVCFVGPQRDIRNCFFAADFLVHPTFYDPCSLVVLEALACGLPIVTTVFNGASELLSPPREGYVIRNPHNHVELADSLIQLLDPARRAACAQAARRAGAGWTFEHHYRQMLRVFTEAANRKQAA